MTEYYIMTCKKEIRITSRGLEPFEVIGIGVGTGSPKIK